LGKRKALIVASWCYPPSWRKATYVVNLDRRDLRLKGECETCCSTIALVHSVVNSGFEVNRIVILGLDSVAKPSTGDLRAEAQRAFERYLERLLQETNVDSEFKEEFRGKCSFAIAPSMGVYWGYRFEGSLEHIFVRAFHAIMEELSRVEGKPYIFFDATHGINFQMQASLYAVIAASIVKELEERLVIINSEPYPMGFITEHCVKEAGEEPPRPQKVSPSDVVLSILDTSKLQHALKIIRALRALSELNEEPLQQAVQHLPSMRERGYEEVERAFSKLLCFVWCLKCRIPGLLFRGARASGREIPFNSAETYRALEDVVRKAEGEDVEFKPEVEEEKRVVKYPKPVLYTVLAKSIGEAVKKLVEELYEAKDLVSFLEAVREIYGERGMTDRVVTVERDRSDYSKIAEELGQGVFEWRSLVDAWCRVKEIPRSAEEVKRRCNPGNFIAHSGLAHDFISRVKIEDGKLIVEVDYDAVYLKRVLQQLNKFCRRLLEASSP